MCKKIDLEVVVVHPNEEPSLGTVHELDETNVFSVAFGAINALQQFTEDFSFTHTSEREDTYTLILIISEDTGKKREEMDAIVESTLVFVTAITCMP